MQNDQATRNTALERLNALIGAWRLEASFPPTAPASIAGRTVSGRIVFEWILGGKFLVQRAEVAHLDAPDNWAIIGFAPERQAYTQHYFDARGVARVYAMTLGEGVWTLLRETPDFTPLDFSQRFTGTFSADGKHIAGRWELRPAGMDWQHDFNLTFTKVS